MQNILLFSFTKFVFNGVQNEIQNVLNDSKNEINSVWKTVIDKNTFTNWFKNFS